MKENIHRRPGKIHYYFNDFLYKIHYARLLGDTVSIQTGELSGPLSPPNTAEVSRESARKIRCE